MKRRLRIERRTLIALADGSTLTVDPGDCWVDEGNEHTTLTWQGQDGLESAPVASAQINVHLARREMVFTSW